MLPDWIPPAALLGLCAIVWAEIKSLRNSRHEHNTRLAKFQSELILMKHEIAELREDVQAIARALGVEVRVGPGQRWNLPTPGEEPN